MIQKTYYDPELRDFFACAAMQAIIAREDPETIVTEEGIAAAAYAQADAMLDQRNKLS